MSLFALIPAHKIGPTATAVAVVGLTFVAAALLWLIRLRKVWRVTLRDALFLIVLAVTFVIQLIEGVDVITQPGDPGAVDTIAILVVVCFLIGIGSAWELIVGPSIGITQRGHGTRPEPPAQRRRLGRRRVALAPSRCAVGRFFVLPGTLRARDDGC